MPDFRKTLQDSGEGCGLRTVSNLLRVINLHLSKAKDKRLKTKKEGKVEEVNEVESKEEEEEEEEMEDEKQTPLKRKRKGKDETLGSRKKVRKLETNDSKDPSYLVVIIVPDDQMPKKIISPSPSKTLKPNKSKTTTSPSKV
ncbi:hypothetical protein CSA_004749 [Cucumis sativus]|uniref:Uncharacterized protein n=1 Tax=Cucumis sativus TaxID=3659 RepID=A0ACB6HC74_CUCSA|nr:hypothetical protein CSA_004749 [Cucumis sativus]